MGHSIGCRMRSCPGAVHPHQAPCLKPSAALPSHQLARNLVAQPSHDARRRPTPPVRATSQPGTTPAAELRVILDTADAQASIKFVDVPNRKGQDIVLCEVRPDSPAAANGLCVGQKLLAISDPVRQNEMWIINDRASFRFVRDAFRMRRWPTIELVVTPEAVLVSDLQAVLQARSLQTVSSSDSDSEGGDFFTGEGVMDPTVVEESVKLVGLTIERQAGVTIGQQLQKAYRQAQPAISAYQQRRQKRRDYLSEVSGRNDSNFFAIVGAFVLGPALLILALAYATGYLDELARNQFL